ncbi:MAG: hypothetical protein Kow0077_08870 [Anaerolineae bacterium]
MRFVARFRLGVSFMSLNSAPSNDLSPQNDDDQPLNLEQEAAQASDAPEQVPESEAAPEALAQASAEAESEAVEPSAEDATEQPEVESEAAPEAVSGEAPVEEAVAAEAVAEAEEETPQAEAAVAEEAVEAPAPEAEAAAEKAAGGLTRGDIVEGTVTHTSPTEILIELKGGITGVVSGRELARMDRRALDELQVGSSVLAYVLNPSNRAGQAVLSLTRALEENDWRRAQEYAESQQIFNGKVSGYNKGGLIVRFGRVRGFVPASQVSEERRQQAQGDTPMERWGGMIGEDIVVKVVEVDRNRNRLILSERAAIKDWRNRRKADLLDKLEVGDIREGRVVSLTDFGAFVDLGGADGLVHLTELSWKHVTRPEEVVQVGDTVKVEVISLDRERRRIGLSMKTLEEDPWDVVTRRFQVGQLVKGTITKLTKFGAFACLDEAPEIEGLIHISELADHRVGHPREVVNEGETLTLRIVKIDRQQRRMGLSLKQVDAIDYLEIDLATYGGEAQAADVEVEVEPAEATPEEAESASADSAVAPAESAVAPAEPEAPDEDSEESPDDTLDA